MEERSEKVACDVLQHFTLELLPTPVFLFTISFATNLFLFLFNRNRKSDVGPRQLWQPLRLPVL